MNASYHNSSGLGPEPSHAPRHLIYGRQAQPAAPLDLVQPLRVLAIWHTTPTSSSEGGWGAECQSFYLLHWEFIALLVDLLSTLRLLIHWLSDYREVFFSPEGFTFRLIANIM